MATYNIGQPFLVIADPRTGGTFLTHCLSSHPDVYCYKKEVLHRREVPRSVFRNASSLAIVRAFVEQQGWGACGVKLVYKELRDPIIGWARGESVRVIHLVRRNAIRVALSRILTGRHRQGEKINYPNERKAQGVPKPTDVPALQLIRMAREYVAQTEAIRDKLIDSTLVSFELFYTDMIGAEGASRDKMMPRAATELCKYLGVPKRTLRCHLYPSAPVPMWKILSNWTEVRKRIESSEMSYCLEDDGEEPQSDQGQEPDSEPGSGEPDHSGCGEPRSEEAPPGDSDDVGPEPAPVAVG